MHRFKMIAAGTHYQDGKAIKAGDTIDSARDLCTVFPNKFQDLGEVSAPQLPPVVTTKVEAPTKEEKASPGKEKAQPQEKESGDVTSQFPDAVKSGLKVFEVSKGLYNVVDPDLGRPINRKPVNRAKVSELV